MKKIICCFVILCYITLCSACCRDKNVNNNSAPAETQKIAEIQKTAETTFVPKPHCDHKYIFPTFVLGVVVGLLIDTIFKRIKNEQNPTAPKT